MDAALRRYLAVTGLRISQTPPKVAELERVLERIEGTAEFAAISPTGAASGGMRRQRLEPWSLASPIRSSDLHWDPNGTFDRGYTPRVQHSGVFWIDYQCRGAVPSRQGTPLMRCCAIGLGAPGEQSITETLSLYEYEAVLEVLRTESYLDPEARDGR